MIGRVQIKKLIFLCKVSLKMAEINKNSLVEKVDNSKNAKKLDKVN